VLRESDKKPGWSLNTKSGHKQEYYRHLTADFYQRFETVEDVNCWARFSFPKLRNILGGLSWSAGAGLPLLISFFYFMESKHKIQEFALYKEAVTRKMARYYN